MNCLRTEAERLKQALFDLARYFTSTNGVPVERATITAKDFWRITGLAAPEASANSMSNSRGATEAVFDLVTHLHRQRDFSLRTFGPGERTAAVLDHIRKELAEIEADPADITEWVDVILLALDGAWRAGHAPEAIASAIADKQARNEARQWPDWRTAESGKAIEHIREEPKT